MIIRRQIPKSLQLPPSHNSGKLHQHSSFVPSPVPVLVPVVHVPGENVNGLTSPKGTKKQISVASRQEKTLSLSDHRLPMSPATPTTADYMIP